MEAARFNLSISQQNTVVTAVQSRRNRGAVSSLVAITHSYIFIRWGHYEIKWGAKSHCYQLTEVRRGRYRGWNVRATKGKTSERNSKRLLRLRRKKRRQQIFRKTDPNPKHSAVQLPKHHTLLTSLSLSLLLYIATCTHVCIHKQSASYARLLQRTRFKRTLSFYYLIILNKHKWHTGY